MVLLVLIFIPAMMFAGGAKEKPAPDIEEAPAAAAVDEKVGGVLVFAMSGDAVGLDPGRETDGNSFAKADNIYNCLVEFKPGSTEVMPALAVSWKVNAAGTEYTFKLRKGVKFHDGTDFNAEAVKWNFDRLAADETSIYTKEISSIEEVVVADEIYSGTSAVRT